MTAVLISWQQALWITGGVLLTIAIILAVAAWKATRK